MQPLDDAASLKPLPRLPGGDWGGHRVRAFQYLAALYASLFGMTGLIKLVSAWQTIPIAWDMDPVFGVQNRFVFLGVGAIETVAGLWILINRRKLRANWSIIAWLCANFLGYRLMLALLGNPKPCACLGNLLSYSPWLEQYGPHLLFATSALGVIAAMCFWMTGKGS